MALTTSEIARIKAELGYNQLIIAALPYIGYKAIFDEIVKPYTQGGAETTSSTAVTAASAPTPVTLTLADSTGFAAGNRIVIDVDTRQEVVTAQSLSGTSLTVQLSLAHSGTYPVLVEGGESIIRSILQKIAGVQNQLASATSTAGLKRVDVIEFYGTTVETTQARTLDGLLKFWRSELALAVGVPDLRVLRRGGQSSVLY